MANYNTVTLKQIEDVYTRALETPNTVFVVESSRGSIARIELCVWDSESSNLHASCKMLRIYNDRRSASFRGEDVTFGEVVNEVLVSTDAYLKHGKEYLRMWDGLVFVNNPMSNMFGHVVTRNGEIIA